MDEGRTAHTTQMSRVTAGPRTGLVIQVGVTAVAILIAMHAGLVAYFDQQARAEEYRKIGSAQPEALMQVRADEKQRLNAGPMPIDKAMHMLDDRKRAGASPDIMPSASLDTAPLQGWVKLPTDVPMPMQAMAASAAQSAAPAPTESAPPAATAPDAGAAKPKRPRKPQ
jgi:hypothetical protein